MGKKQDVVAMASNLEAMAKQLMKSCTNLKASDSRALFNDGAAWTAVFAA